jgi:hypothetical protein
LLARTGTRPIIVTGALLGAGEAWLAAALITASSTLGAALGLAILTAIATSRTNDVLTAHAGSREALTSGFQHAVIAARADTEARRGRRGQRILNPHAATARLSAGD